MKTVLIIEDNRVNMELTVQLLEGQYEIVSAGDGATGVHLSLIHSPDLIVMDLSLPVMDGWQAIREIRQNPATEHIPVLALSAHADEVKVARAMAAGANEYLTKPVDEDALVEAVTRLTGS